MRNLNHKGKRMPRVMKPVVIATTDLPTPLPACPTYMHPSRMVTDRFRLDLSDWEEEEEQHNFVDDKGQKWIRSNEIGEFLATIVQSCQLRCLKGNDEPENNFHPIFPPAAKGLLSSNSTKDNLPICVLIWFQSVLQYIMSNWSSYLTTFKSWTWSVLQ